MPRWSNNLKSNCKDIMDNNIKNIKPDLYQHLLLDIIGSNLENNKKTIEKFLRNKLNLTTSLSKHTKGYWASRGWTDAESYIKSKENKRKNCKSVYSQQTWLERINPVTGINYTIEEADFERNSRRPIRKEYWVKKGHSVDKAVTLALTTKDKNNKKGASSSAVSEVRKITSKRSLEYYTARGHSLDEATKLRSTSQCYFSKELCINQLGEEHGIAKWQARQLQWKDSLKKSGLYLGISKSSLLLFDSLAAFYPNLLFGNNEYTITCSGKIYCVDCFLKDSNKIIEFYGDYWHANPAKFSSDAKIKTNIAKDIWQKDKTRLTDITSYGYQVLVIWESETKKDLTETINRCLHFLQQ